MASRATAYVAEVDGRRLAAIDRNRPQLAVAREDQRLAIAGPVGRLDVVALGEYDLGYARIGIDGDGLQRTVESHLRRCSRRGERLQYHIRKRRTFHRILVVRACAQARIKWPIELHLDGRACLV